MAAPVRPQQKAPAAKQAPPREPAPPPDAPKEPKEPKVRRGSLLPAIVIAVALLGAAFMLKSGGDGGGGGTAAEGATTETTATDHGDPAHVVALDSITLNLADGRFLKLGLALQLAEGTEAGDPASFGARALDEAIDLMGSYTYRELTAEGARNNAKNTLSEAVSEAYDGAVLSVYFTEFVMQ